MTAALRACGFKNVEFLAKGHFGRIYSIKSDEINKDVVIKIFKSEKEKDTSMELREINILMGYSHPNVLNGIKIIANEDCPNIESGIILMKASGDLIDYIDSDDNKLEFLDRNMMANDIVDGIRFLHNVDVLHKDIKPDNILVVHESKHKIKCIVSDFGLVNVVGLLRMPWEKLCVSILPGG